MKLSNAIFLFFSLITGTVRAQSFDVEKVRTSADYVHNKDSILHAFKNIKPGKFGEFVKGVDEDIVTLDRVVALTLDACGGKHGGGYDADLINYLRQQKIAATLFITGLWIDQNPTLFRQLAADTLFEIENHGLNHQPCSLTKETPYDIAATDGVSAAVDEMELNARKIKALTGRRPAFYRSATAETDEGCTKVAAALRMTIVSFDILSGDVGGTKKEIVANNILSKLSDGAIIIGHMNHPEWNTYEALRLAVPEIKKKGFKFVKLQHQSLRGR